MRWVLGIIGVAIVAAAAGLFLTGSRGEIREITETTATSNCIGESSSVTCAVETWLACNARMDESFCRTAVFGKRATANCADVLKAKAYDDPVYSRCDTINLAEDVDASATHMRYRITGIRAATDAERNEEGWLKESTPPAVYVVSAERWRCLPQPNEDKAEKAITAALPVDSPGDSIGQRLRSLKRRLQTIAWEYGLAYEPFRAAWYDVGADYCWVPLTYWVGKQDGEWRVVRWTNTGYYECELACGCPEFRWPPYRKIDQNACGPLRGNRKE